MIEALMERLKSRLIISHCGSANLNGYVFGPTAQERRRAEQFHCGCSYVGSGPVPLADYVISVEAQSICDPPYHQEFHCLFHKAAERLGCNSDPEPLSI